MRLLYLAQALDQAHGSGQRGWADQVADAITGHTHGDIGVYRPGRAWQLSLTRTLDPRLEQLNREALGRCDALVAVAQRGVPSIGMPREIEAFAATGKPWAVITDLHEAFALADALHSFPLNASGIDSLCRWASTIPHTNNVPVGDDPDPLLFSKDGDYDGRLPTRAHSGDAGFDLYAAADTVVPYRGFADVPCGVRVALPDGVWGRIAGRSSTIRTRGLLVAEGVIDTGYRGSLFAGVWNQGPAVTTVRVGERIAQLILAPNISPNYRASWASAAEFERIPHDGRGDAGFGSSGS